MKSRLKKYWVLGIILSAIMLITAGCGDIGRSAKTEPGRINNSALLIVNFLDVGQGDAILIRTPEQVILVDTGDVPARDKLVSFIKKQGISIIDKVIITHPHADHLGGMAAVLENFTVKNIYDSGQTTTSAMYRQYLSAVQKKKIPFAVLEAGNQLEIGGGVIAKVLAPEKPFIGGSESDLNNNSIVMKIIYQDFSMLLTADAGIEAERRIIKSNTDALKSNILKSGHHGSRTSSSPAFLKEVSPEAIVISLGAGNEYHHPHPSTLKKYTERNYKIYRTDSQGEITVTSDGKTYNISKER